MMMDWREKMRRRLGEMGWTAEDFAGRCDTSVHTVRKWLRQDGTVPDLFRGLAAARALDVPAEWLYSDADWPPPSRQGGLAPADPQAIDAAVRRVLGEIASGKPPPGF